MATVRSILRQKVPRVLISIEPDASTLDAIKLMAKHDVGAIVVLDGEHIIGLFTEREYARKVILMGRASRDTPVRETMIDKLLVVSPDKTIEECMKLMTERRIRYLPVMEGDEFLGIISIGDVLKAVLDAQARNIDHLERYITASDYGM
jgi:CBS domain-containing protein